MDQVGDDDVLHDLARPDDGSERARLRKASVFDRDPGHRGTRDPGFRSIDMMRRELGDEAEFAPIMWFDDVGAVKAFVGEDHEIAHVPAAARAVLSRFDDRAVHYDLFDRREQAERS